MSCASPACDSAYAIEATSPSLPSLRWWNRPFAWLVGIALAWERRCHYKQLLERDDRLLADIGVSRTTIEELHRSLRIS
jgi:uncharacterized protein YjiS (DUF1127 family)